jgi:hypothetical protein
VTLSSTTLQGKGKVALQRLEDGRYRTLHTLYVPFGGSRVAPVAARGKVKDHLRAVLAPGATRRASWPLARSRPLDVHVS